MITRQWKYARLDVQEAMRRRLSGYVELKFDGTIEDNPGLIDLIEHDLIGLGAFEIEVEPDGAGHRLRVHFNPSQTAGRPPSGHVAIASEGRSRAGLLRPPGARLDAFASFFFSKRTYATVLKPHLAEMQEEYFEALSEGRLRKARWVRVRGVICFWSHVLLQLPVSATKLVKKLWTVAGG